MPPERRPQQWQPLRQHSPVGVARKLPVLSTQDVFRQLVALSEAQKMDSEASQLTLVDRAVSSTPAGGLRTSQALVPFDVTFQAPKPRGRQLHSPVASKSPVPMRHDEAQVAKINSFIREELAILAAQCDGGAATVTQQRLAVFKAAHQMVLPLVSATIAELLQRIIWEHDVFIQEVEKQVSDTSLLRERKKIEQYFEKYYIDTANEKERDLEKRRGEFDATEVNMRLKLKALENQNTALRDENARLKSQQNDDSERFSAMGQAVVDARLTAQKAELAMAEMRQEIDKVRVAEKHHYDIVDDYYEMSRLLKNHHINFDPKCKFIVEAMMAQAKKA